ncbi:MAG: hexokinase [Planctomycetes bacterium B3_Pla]|nr:MAG: hexokinase [Planctomycetes bacterium B3_Pla]
MREIKDKVRRFLKDNAMYHEDIDMDALCDVFSEEMRTGLAGKDSSLAMIPTYIEVGKKIPAGKPVIVLDAGGTHFRVAAVCFDESGKPVVENFAQRPMPGLDKEVGREEFFAAIAEYMAGVADVSGNIGFCFSYPTEILPNKDGRLIRFCKEVKAKEVEGELIGENLAEAIEAAGYKGGKRVVILNDTVATLLAGMSAFGKRDFGSYVGFILGTGSNCCYIESNRNILKKSDLNPDKEQIVNIESGSFGKAPRGGIDLQLDETTLDPGKYTFEKMFSGAYLGALCLKALQQAGKQELVSRAVADELLAAEELQTKDVNSFMRDPRGDNPLAVICAKAAEQDCATVWYVLDGIIERAARLVAALLSAVVLATSKGENPCMPVCITAEGTTFYELKGLKEGVERHLKSFLQDKHGRHIELVSVENATLIGAAIAGLTN